MAIYQSWKNIFSRIEFPIDDLRLVEFFEGVVGNKYTDYPLTEDKFILQENDCSKISRKKLEKEIKKEEELEQEIKNAKAGYDPKMKTDL